MTKNAEKVLMPRGRYFARRIDDGVGLLVAVRSLTEITEVWLEEKPDQANPTFFFYRASVGLDALPAEPYVRTKVFTAGDFVPPRVTVIDAAGEQSVGVELSVADVLAPGAMMQPGVAGELEIPFPRGRLRQVMLSGENPFPWRQLAGWREGAAGSPDPDRDPGAPSGNCRTVDFDTAEVIPGIVNGTFFLRVAGTVPCLNMSVSLVPRVYIRCPEFWGIEVVACLSGGICLTAVERFSATLPLAGVTGSQGIEVIGASSARKIDVDGGCI